MSITKMPLIRYKVLDRCFRNPGRKYFIDNLIEEVSKVLTELDQESNGISRRQILEDIKFMESKEGYNIELNRTYEGKRVFYRYVDITFSINNMPLNENDINQIRSAIKILTQFKGMPQFELMNELLPKLQEGIEVGPTKSIMSFDNNQYLKGIEKLGELFNAILYESVLIITYQDFYSESPYDLTIHPYYLKQYNNRWFLFGYNPEVKKYNWNLALDRIVGIRVAKLKYNQNNKINWEEYFDDMIGVTKPENGTLENVVLHFLNNTGKYVESKPIHGSQKSKWLDTETLEVRLQLIINFELERLVLSFANNVIVIKPLSLARKIKKQLVEAAEQYGG